MLHLFSKESDHAPQEKVARANDLLKTSIVRDDGTVIPPSA